MAYKTSTYSIIIRILDPRSSHGIFQSGIDSEVAMFRLPSAPTDKACVEYEKDFSGCIFFPP